MWHRSFVNGPRHALGRDGCFGYIGLLRRAHRNQARRPLSPFSDALCQLLPGRASSSVRKTLSEAGTASGARRMRGRSWEIAEGAAHLLNSLVVEPALQNALCDRPAIGPKL